MVSPKRPLSVVFALALGGLLYGPIAAQAMAQSAESSETSSTDPDPPAASNRPTRPTSGIFIPVRTAFRQTFGIDDPELFGGIAVRRVDLGTGALWMADRTLRIGLNLDAGYHHYDVGDQPFDFYEAGLSVSLIASPWEVLTVFTSAGVRAAAEWDIDPGTAESYRTMALLAWKLSDGFTLSAGFMLSTRQERAPLYIPLVGIRWKITDDWILDLARSAEIRYRLGIALDDGGEFRPFFVFLGLGFDGGDYRLRWRSGRPEGYLDYLGIGPSTGLLFYISPAMNARLSVGLTFAQYSFRDHNGDTLDTVLLSPSPTVALSLSFTF